MFDPIKVSKINPIKDFVLVKDMNFRERITTGGIILPTDNGKSEGIRPRWGEVYAVGPDQTDVQVGEWVLVAHGRWTRGSTIEDDTGVHVVRRIDTNDILMVSDEPPAGDDTMSNAISGNPV